MSLTPVKYPLDKTGVAVSNKVESEPHTLRASMLRPVVLKSGAFFNESIVVRDAATNRILTKNIDFYGTVLYELPTEAYGKEIYQVVVIVDQTCGANILVDYQALGGEFSYSWDAIVQMVAELGLDNRPVAFDAILGKPAAYNPGPHLHDAGDVYGFEYVVAAIERVGSAIRIGAAAAETKFFDYVDGQVRELNDSIAAAVEGHASQASVIAALQYTPVNKAGDTFEGPMKFNKGITLAGFFKEKLVKLTATTATTTLDLSLAGNYQVTLAASGALVFDTTQVPALQPDEVLSFTLALVNDATAGRAVAFPSNVVWADKVIPPRTPGANARDEYYFSTFDSGATWTGSLSNENVG